MAALKERGKPLRVIFKPALADKIKDYCDLQEIGTTKYVTALVQQDLQGKVFNNNSIKLDKPYYFNIKELFKNKTTVATPKQPLTTYDIYVIKEIPNNFDTFNEKENTYCYQDKYTHRGLYIHSFIENYSDFKEVETNSNWFLFEYNQEAQTIEIHYTRRNDAKHFTNFRVLNKVEQENTIYTNNIVDLYINDYYKLFRKQSIDWKDNNYFFRLLYNKVMIDYVGLIEYQNILRKATPTDFDEYKQLLNLE